VTQVRSLIEDIRDVRFHKVETGLETISGRTHAVKVTSVALSKLLCFVWMSILEGVELNWVQLQISHGIEMSCNSNFIVWMSLNRSLELWSNST
jgi:hypothetical protein